MQTREKKKKSYWFFSSPENISAPKPICDGDICFRPPVGSLPAAPTSPNPMSTPQQSFYINDAEKDVAEILEKETFYLNIIPADLITVLKEATRKGCLYAFLCTLTEEVLTENLKERFTAKQIYLANLAAKTLILLLATQSAKTLVAPLANLFLTEYGKINEKRAGYISTGLVVALEAVTSPLSFARTAAIFVASVGGSVVGSQAGKWGFGLFQAVREKTEEFVLNKSLRLFKQF